MADPATLKAAIRNAFAGVEFPGDWCLRGSNEGDEPFLVEREFAGKNDWTRLDAEFLDQAPDGFGSALSFFSDEAFHFYLPAYLIADIDGALDSSNPVFHLCHGLDDHSKNDRVNPRRYGERTWLDERRHQFAIFNRAEAAAIVEYFKIKRDADDFLKDTVEQALKNYWLDRAGVVG